MLQIYFLSVLLNVIAGLILVYASVAGGQSANSSSSGLGDDFNLEDDTSFEDGPLASTKKNLAQTSAAFLNDSTFRLVIAALSGLVGLIKLFYTTVPDDIPVLGDFLPAIASLMACVCLFVEWFESQESYEGNLPGFLDLIFMGGRKIFGLVCLVAGLLHFIFPRLLFL